MGASARPLLFLLFALSGLAGLIYEAIWTQYLKLFLGHAAYAQTLVLAIFMGGMAIGAWLASRHSGRWASLLRAYAVTEAAIGLAALGFHDVFVATTGAAYAGVLPRLTAAPAVAALKWGLSAAMILPQSVLLGMTFPLMSAGVLRRFPDRPGRSVAMLYFTNSLGAAAGVLASGFLLVRVVGLPGTLRIAGLLNLAVAVAVWALAGSPGPAAFPRPAPGAGDRRPDRAWALLLGVALVTGASSFMYEIAWIRMLGLVLGTSTHAFELMLSAFILGLALGGLWIQRRIDHLATPVRALGYVQVAMGLLALATLPIYGNAFAAMRWLVLGLPRTDGGYALFNLASSGLAMAIMLPATFCAGMTLPLITARLLREGYGERSIGAVYALNTVGAIVGVVLAVHVGLPRLGLKGLVVLGAGLDIALGIGLGWSAGAAFATRRAPGALALGGGAGLVAALLLVHLDPYLMASGVYRHGTLLGRQTHRIEHHRDGKTATISLVSDAAGGKRITTNGKVDASLQMIPGRPPDSGDEATMILLGVLPMALHPGARTAACIGLGSGLTTHTLLASPRLVAVDTVEIEPEVVVAARHFLPRNARVYEDPRSRIVIDDAKAFFASGGRRYDLIVSEPSNPWVSGVAGLFSREFYRLVARHLAEGGLFVQWIQLYEIDVDLVVSVLKALGGVFDDYVVYATNDVDALVVARNGGRVGTPDPDVLRLPALAPALGRAHVAGLQDLEVRRVGTKRLWNRFVRSFAVPANSDYEPVLDQHAARARFLRVNAQGLLGFSRSPLPALELLAGPPPSPRGPAGVTPSPFFEPSRRAALAPAILERLLGRPPGPDHPTIPPEIRDDASRAAVWLRRCADPGGPAEAVARLVALSPHLLPHLAPAEIEPLWALLDGGPCARALAPGERAWLDLLRAVGARDAGGMAQAGRALLRQAPALPADAISYLVSAGMLGSLAQGDRAGARELWARHAAALGGRDDLLLRLLVAESAVP